MQLITILPVILFSGKNFLGKFSLRAGSGVVHVTGGIAALVGAKILGPRKGRFDEMVDQTEFIPHSIPLIVLGNPKVPGSNPTACIFKVR